MLPSLSHRIAKGWGAHTRFTVKKTDPKGQAIRLGRAFPQPRTNKNSGFVTNDLYCGYEKHILVACAGSSMAIRSVNRFAKACIPSRTCGRRITSCFPIFCLQALIPEYFASRHGISILLSSINPIF